MNDEQIKSFFRQRRSIRRFQQKPISFSILKECVNCARLIPSGKNLQPLEYIIVTDSSLRKKLFSCLHWAGYLPSWEPSEDEQPMAYIVLINSNKNEGLVAYDVGIASAHIVLFAETKNVGSCILLNIDKQRIEQLLKLPNYYQLEGVIALGYKNESPVIETDDNNREYWLDENQVLHVPKRSLDSILHNQTY
ncbi:MAG TPA: nitroreductase family protein [Candidatus Thermoplasmatota archaeon]|nr:nitroreductase family protein [Candidatus Thermoplasmatota archaeon]